MAPTSLHNARDCALIFEGGGMRCALTAAVASTLLRLGIVFPKVYGISAGAELACDYASASLDRADHFFIDLAMDPRAGGARSFFAGRGFFDTVYAFSEVARKAEAGESERTRAGVIDYKALRFDFGQLQSPESDAQIEAFDAASGKTAVWTKTSMTTLDAVMERVAASCSYPLFTPPLFVDGVRYIDGGMGESHGICLDAAIADGFTRFFIVRSQPRSFRMPPVNGAKRAFYRAGYSELPRAYEAIVARPAAYNALLDRIDELERQGVACVFCPDEMPISYMTASPARLQAAYQLGRRQCAREIDRWVEWLL